MSEKHGGWAFPHVAEGGADSGLHPNVEFGMTLRDYFAAKAMAAWLGTFGDRAHHPCDTTRNGDGGDYGPAIAELSYKLADAMLSHRAQEKPE